MFKIKCSYLDHQLPDSDQTKTVSYADRILPEAEHSPPPSRKVFAIGSVFCSIQIGNC